MIQIIIYEYIYRSHRKYFINSHHTVHVILPLSHMSNVISCRMRPEWASSTDINKTPVSKLVVYRGMINDVTLWPADGNSYRDRSRSHNIRLYEKFDKHMRSDTFTWLLSGNFSDIHIRMHTDKKYVFIALFMAFL